MRTVGRLVVGRDAACDQGTCGTSHRSADLARPGRRPVAFAPPIPVPAGGPTVNFAFSEEQDQLRDAVRDSSRRSRRDRGPAPDGDHRGLRPRGVVADGQRARTPGSAHPRGVRRPGLHVRRARHRARGDGPRAAVRAVLLDRRPRGRRDPERRHRRPEDGAAPRHRERRDDRDARVHRAERQVGRVGHHDGGRRAATATRSTARRCS